VRLYITLAMSLSRRRALVLAGATLIAPRPALAAGRIAFEVVNGKIIVPVTINGQAAEAVLDSGSVFSGLDAAAARRRAIAASGRSVQVRGAQARTSGRYSPPVRLEVAGYILPALSMVVLDYSSLSLTVGHVIEALVGADVFAAFVVDIDFAAKSLAFHPRAEFGAPRDATLVPLKAHGKAVTAPITVDGKVLQALVDTGSDAPLIASPGPANAAGLLKGRKVSSTVIGGVGGASTGRITSASKVALAGAAFSNVPVQVTARSLGVEANLGLGILSRFHLWMDVTGRRMWLRPNGDATPFPRDALGFYGLIEGQAIRVSHVAAGGPAASAGLKAGDLITQINGEPAVKANQALKGSGVGTKLALSLSRGATVRLVMAEYY